MPETKIQVYQERPDDSPVLRWIDTLPSNSKGDSDSDKEDEDDEAISAHSKCLALILLLEEKGCNLRRPHTDILRDGIWELRWHIRKVQYRILYTFIGKNSALLLLGCTKEKTVPPKLIEKAIIMKKKATDNPEKHIARFGA